MTLSPAPGSADAAASKIAATPAPRKPPSWWQANGFIIGLFGAVALAFVFPGPGSRHGILHADILNNAGIALILFLQGLSLAFEKVKEGAGNWRLHLVIQSFTFVIFPLVGLAMDAVVPLAWPGEPPAIRYGFLYLCVLPSTVSTSVVLTAVAGGNTPGALFNAAVSNIVGVVATPILVQLLMSKSGSAGDFGPLLLKITLLTLVPFGLGMALRPAFAAWVDARKQWVTRISNTVILFIVYSAFCESVEENIWAKYGIVLTLQVLVLVLVLFGGMSLLIFAACKLLRLPSGDAIAAYFCSIKKTLAMGVPLAILIFGQRDDLTLILLPIMFYHPVQLFINGLLANQWARQAAHH
ncbi:bile acid:sodium symporter [Verrucomicrobia bacterium LW23]|nr:bile acid:sodium symporter [Verrucomicrobia bacterium LW23]